MKKSLRMILLSSLVLSMGLVACGGGDKSSDTSKEVPTSSDVTSTSETSGDTATSTSEETPSSSEEVLPNIASVEIETDETTVLDGQIVNCKATVTPVDTAKEYSKKVDWASSDESVATVKNGAVTFLPVTEDKQVTITATSKEDPTKKGEAVFTVKHSPIDLYNSKPGTIDSSMFAEDGTFTTGEDTFGDVAMVSADAHGAKFYFEAEITMLGSQNDAYPKFGLMVADNNVGNWVGQGEGVQSLFFYLDTVASSMGAGVNTYGFVADNDTASNWEWGTRPTPDINFGNKIKYGDTFRMAIIRDGTHYVTYAENKDAELVAIKSFNWAGIPADKDAYVWAGGFNTAATIKVIKATTDLNSIYATPTQIDVDTTAQLLYIDETYKIEPVANVLNYDPAKLKIESSDTTVMTIDANGVTHGVAAGQAKAVVTYEGTEIRKEIPISYTDDATVKTVLDGKMDDALWTNEVKANYAAYTKGDYYEEFHATKNARGVYIFAELYTKTQHTGGSDWWKGDNFELKIRPQADANWEGGQMWFSSQNRTNLDASNVYISAYEEARGMYKLTMEILIPYAAIGGGVNAESTIYAGGSWGSNPGGEAWHCFNDPLVISTNGIFAKDGVSAAPRPNCDGGHHNTRVVTKPVTCLEDGEYVDYCLYCGTETTGVIESNGQHQYDYSKATVVTAPTCSATGIGTGNCEICGSPCDSIVLPIDPNNHDGHWPDGALMCSECGHGEHIDPNKVYPVWGNHQYSGWGDHNANLKVINALSGDFTAVVEEEVWGCLEGEAANWQFATISLYPSTDLNDTKLLRFDAIGWLADDTNSVVNGDSINYGTPYWVVNPDQASDQGDNVAALVEIFKHAILKVTITRTGNDVSVVTNIHAVNTNTDYTLTQGFTSTCGDNLCIEFGGERALTKTTSVKVNGVEQLPKGVLSEVSCSSNNWNFIDEKMVEVLHGLKGEFDFTLTGSFQVNIDFSKQNFGDECWKGPLYVLRNSEDHGKRAVGRWDWFGWTDGGGLGEGCRIQTGDDGIAWIDWSFDNMGKCMSDATFVLHATRVGSEITYVWNIHSNVLNTDYVYTQKIFNATAPVVDFCFAPESANWQVTSAVINK